MWEETNPPAQAIVSNEERAGQLIQEAKALDGIMKLTIRATADQMVQRGQLLIKAQQMAGKGNFDAALAKNWAEISRSTAYRNMRLATEAARSRMVTLVESHTHLQLDDKGFDEDSDDPDAKPLTVQERKVLMLLIKRDKPAQGKKLLDGSKKATDAELKAIVGPACDKCRRLGPPAGKPCEVCEKLKKGEQGKLWEEGQEPDDENDPASAPKPPPDPYAKAKKLLTELASVMTRLIGEDPKLYEALTACGVIEHKTGEAPKFRAVLGVGSVIDNVQKDEPLSVIKRDYDIKSGRLVLPMYERKKS